MRVLLLKDSSNQTSQVFSISNIGYEEEIEVENKFHIEYVSGLYMEDLEGDGMYIENVSKTECEAICREILEKGYMDLRQYGEYFWC
ncbi:MAG: hypothetical protein SOT84_12560 [Bariatricus sp.]|nr:hypothetical protein [Bariatricus sp.]